MGGGGGGGGGHNLWHFHTDSIIKVLPRGSSHEIHTLYQFKRQNSWTCCKVHALSPWVAVSASVW